MLGPEPQGSGPVAKLALGRMSNPHMLPTREDRAGSRRSWAGAERSLVDGGGTRVRAMNIDGTGGVTNRLQCGLRSDSDGRSLRIA